MAGLEYPLAERFGRGETSQPLSRVPLRLRARPSVLHLDFVAHIGLIGRESPWPEFL